MKVPESARKCQMSESTELLTQIEAATGWKMPVLRDIIKEKKYTISESAELLTQIDAGRGQDPLEDACLERQRMREFNGLFCQIALGDHNV